ncbi:hypothetical protein FF38_08818 [Lucilia cuprina]|uniref:Uncharacterized protein n=1 Tax=Lucilia cuprina TaxID=7375 RepID=A0A0L0BQX5_LUCCU|nr:hypothetical protein FF38_08818 [Lucilia cuprina]
MSFTTFINTVYLQHEDPDEDIESKPFMGVNG